MKWSLALLSAIAALYLACLGDTEGSDSPADSHIHLPRRGQAARREAVTTSAPSDAKSDRPAPPARHWTAAEHELFGLFGPHSH